MKFTSVLGFGLFTMSQTNASDLNRFKFTLIFFSLSAIQICSCKVSLNAFEFLCFVRVLIKDFKHNYAHS